MIPIRTPMGELDTVDRVRALAFDCYVSALRNVAHYAIELEDELTRPHRQYLTALAEDVAAGTPEVLAESRATLRGLLRDYRDKASQYLNGLRSELASSAKALEEILNTLAESESDYEIRLKRAVEKLQEICRSPLGDAVRPALAEAAETIGQSLEEIRRQHQLTVSQFICEIRLLHQRIDALERAASIDNLTKLFNRREMEEHIRMALGGASILLLTVVGFSTAEAEFGQEVATELAAAFTRRLRNSVAADAVLGRWSAQNFLAIGPPRKAEAITRAKWVAENLSGTYCCLLAGRTVRPTLEVGATVVERPAGDNGDRTLLQIAELSNNGATSATADPHQ
ncbi:MAG TPA: diguanylate cyclase [Bryobacteraceae bacterium]|nr:diguanylate cyclase [Bryobacteraceae bacterium]